MVTMHLLNINIVEKNKENIVDSSIRVGNIEGKTQYELSLASTVNLWQQLDRSFGSFFFFPKKRWWLFFLTWDSSTESDSKGEAKLCQ